MPTATIGSGGDYATLAAWWTAIKDSATDTYIAELVSNLTGGQSISGAGTNDKTLIIRTDGPRRSITGTSNTNVLLINTATIANLTIEDLTLDGASQGSAVSALYPQIIKTGGTVTCRRLIMCNAYYGSRGPYFDPGHAMVYENCLCYNCDAYGFYFNSSTQTLTHTVKHCGAYDCLNGLYVTADTGLTTNVYNSWFLNNATVDLSGAGSNGSFNIYNCVISKASASFTDTFSGCAVSKTAYTDYFTDPANGDFTLKDDDEALWGINSDGANSPADDLLGETRVNDDIGPYEYLNAPPTISSVTLSGTSQIGQTLTATVVTDQDPVDSTTYQWQKASDGSGTGAADISGETSSTLALTYADFGDLLDTAAYVRCGAIATKNSLASDEAFSAWQQVTVASGGGFSGSPLKSPFLIS